MRVREGWLRGIVGSGGSKPLEVKEVPVDTVLLNPYQPRRSFNDDEMQALIESVREHGVLQPVVVRRLGAGYELVAGERRLRAAKAAGLKVIPAVVKDLSDREMAMLALVENLQRSDLSFMDEAEGYRRLLVEFQLTQEELARQVGKSQSTIANKLRLLKLPEEVKKIISPEIFSERHARALLRLSNAGDQIWVAQEVRKRGLTVEATEALVDELLKGRAGERASKGTGGKRIKVIKDVRIFLNSFRKAVEELRAAGVPVSLTETDGGDYIEVRVRIEKSSPWARGRVEG